MNNNVLRSAMYGFVICCLILITYGVLYSNLPCSMQLLEKTFNCQIAAWGESERAFEKAHGGRSPGQVDFDNWVKKSFEDYNKSNKRTHVPDVKK